MGGGVSRIQTNCSAFFVLNAPPSTYDERLENLIWIPEDHSRDKDWKINPVAWTTKDISNKFPALLLRDRSKPGSHLIMYFHGNSCDLGSISYEMKQLHSVLGCGVLAIEYPGYGITQGLANATPAGVDAWAHYAFSWLLKLKYPPENIVLFGRSIGTGPATLLALRAHEFDLRVRALVLQSPYTSLRNIVREHFWAAPRLFPDVWDSQDCLRVLGKRKCELPLLIIHGRKDEVINCSHGEALFNNYKGKKHLHIANSGHNDYLLKTDVVTPIEDFLHNTYSKSPNTETKQIPLIEPESVREVPAEYLTTRIKQASGSSAGRPVALDSKDPRFMSDGELMLQPGVVRSADWTSAPVPFRHHPSSNDSFCSSPPNGIHRIYSTEEGGGYTVLHSRRRVKGHVPLPRHAAKGAEAFRGDKAGGRTGEKPIAALPFVVEEDGDEIFDDFGEGRGDLRSSSPRESLEIKSSGCLWGCL